MSYGGFGGVDGLSDAMADLNDAFGDLSGPGEVVSGTFKLAIPVVAGAALTFGTVAAMDWLIETPSTRDAIKPYVWLIGAGVGTIAGIIMWKVPKLGATYGVLTIAASITLALLKYLEGYVGGMTASTAGYRAYEVRKPQPIYGRFSRYEVQNPQAIYGRYRGLGEGQMVNLRGLGEGQMVNMAPGRSSVLQGAINPGVFG